ncbi:hypothetical protein [Nostoc sp. MS1]|uniref:hypothetical protein n=1 Tax=Nostoc sp. MS1 TaxID=2764711 RepID=UPI001CC43A34|nr:hypothetical protein [Nostoc sp. MS1]BCL37595.1 hypothetical protein NSMS1_40420 [Nostoc sp. MS1]
MYNAKGNLQRNVIRSIFAALHTGLIFIGLVGCNAEEKVPSVPTEVKPPTVQPEVPNKQKDDDKEKENDDKEDDKEDKD